MINMTSAQIQMYLEGKTEVMLEKLKEYEIKEYKRAFADGGDTAWDRYRKNVLRKVKKFNKVYGINVDADVLMAY